MAKLLTLEHAEMRLKLVMDFFDNDTSKFLIHLSGYLCNNKRFLHSHKIVSDINGEKQKQKKENKNEKPEIKKVITNMSPSATTIISDVQAKKKDNEIKVLTTAIEKDETVDLVSLLKNSKDGEVPLSKKKLEFAQKIRRASSIGTITKNICSENGRRLSAIEKNAAVVDAAIKLAEVEEKEVDQIEIDIHDVIEDFQAGDEVIVMEGINCGLFGVLQSRDWWDIWFTFGAVKEDEEGCFGVDVHTENGLTEGYWVDPLALQPRKYEIGSEVMIIDGINKGKKGTIQSNGNRILIEKKCFGVDVLLGDGSLQGYWIHPRCLKLLSEYEEEKKKEEEKEEMEDLDEIDTYDFLPYIPFPGDDMDKALAEALNSSHIDVNIKRIVTNSGKVVYRYDGKRHIVRFIHGLLLVKEGGSWEELIPILRKLAGMEEEESTNVLTPHLDSSNILHLDTDNFNPYSITSMVYGIAKGLNLVV